MTDHPKAREIISAIVALKLGPALTSQGFKQTKLNFSRSYGRTLQQINIRLSSFNIDSMGSFTPALNILFEEMHTGEDSLKKLARENERDFYCELNILLSERPEIFSVNEHTDIYEHALKLEQFVVDNVVVPLNKVKCLADFEATGWVHKDLWSFPARYAYHMGRLDEALRLINYQIEYFADRKSGITAADLIKRYRLPKLRC